MISVKYATFLKFPFIVFELGHAVNNQGVDHGREGLAVFFTRESHLTLNFFCFFFS